MAGDRGSRVPVPTGGCCGLGRSPIGGRWIPDSWLAHLKSARTARAKKTRTTKSQTTVVATTSKGACTNAPKIVQDRAPQGTERSWPQMQGQNNEAKTDKLRLTYTPRPEYLAGGSKATTTPDTTGGEGTAEEMSSNDTQLTHATSLQRDDASTELTPPTTTTPSKCAEHGLQSPEAPTKETVEALLKRLRRETKDKRVSYRHARKPDDFATEQLTTYEIALMKRRTEVLATAKFGVYRDQE